MRRTSLVVVAALLVVFTSVPTGSMSAAQSNRGVVATVASDADAYVGIEMHLDEPAHAGATSWRNSTRTGPTGNETRGRTRGVAAKPNRTAGRNDVEPPVRRGQSPRTLSVTVRNQVPNLDGFVAVVSVERGAEGARPISDRILVEDEATAILTPVSCADTVRITVRGEDVTVELTRPVPCESNGRGLPAESRSNSERGPHGEDERARRGGDGASDDGRADRR